MAISHEAPNGVKFFTSFLVMHRLLKVLRSDQIIYSQGRTPCELSHQSCSEHIKAIRKRKEEGSQGSHKWQSGKSLLQYRMTLSPFSFLKAEP